MNEALKELFHELRSMISDLDDLSYDMLEHPKADALCELIDKLKQWSCRASEHDWIYDQCGYWQHQYCVRCGSAKYPGLAKRSCGDLTAEMGKMGEAEWLENNNAHPVS